MILKSTQPRRPELPKHEKLAILLIFLALGMVVYALKL